MLKRTSTNNNNKTTMKNTTKLLTKLKNWTPIPSKEKQEYVKSLNIEVTVLDDNKTTIVHKKGQPVQGRHSYLLALDAGMDMGDGYEPMRALVFSDLKATDVVAAVDVDSYLYNIERGDHFTCEDYEKIPGNENSTESEIKAAMKVCRKALTKRARLRILNHNKDFQ